MRSNDFHQEAMRFIDVHVKDKELKDSLVAYLDYVVRRDK